jgi:hypothetical protein
MDLLRCGFVAAVALICVVSGGQVEELNNMNATFTVSDL